MDSAVQNRLSAARVAASRGRWLQAREAFEQALQGGQQPIDVLLEMMNVLEQLQDHGRLLQLLDEAIASQPLDERLRMRRARVLASLGRFEAARDDYLEVLAQVPGHAGAFCALVYAGEGRIAGGMDKLEVLLGNAQAHSEMEYRLVYARGRLLEQAGRYTEAFEAYREANTKQAALGGMDIEAKRRAAVGVMQDLAPEVITPLIGRGNPTERPVFIVGMPRSGTSLVEQILSCHPEVKAVGEQLFLGRVLRGLISSASRRPGPIIAAIDRLGESAWRRAGGRYLRHLEQLGVDAERVTDKLPANFALLPWIRLLLPKARIIHVRRNPLATLYSCIRTPFADPALSFEIENWARFYGLYQVMMSRWAAVGGDLLLTVDYESLVTDLPSEARRLVGFLGLDWAPECLHPERSMRAVHTASHSQVRHGVHAASIELWRRNSEALEALQPVIDESRLALEQALAE